jgi:hypothetical protein
VTLPSSGESTNFRFRLRWRWLTVPPAAQRASKPAGYCLVAADINNGALLPSSNTPSDAGQGAAIATLSQQVTIYYSAGDDVLPWSKNFLTAYHVPSYGDRLGLDGPSSYANLLPRTCGVDCSAVINDAAIQLAPQVPPGTSAHSSYFYIPQVLEDWAQTLAGTAPAAVRSPGGSPAPLPLACNTGRYHW